MTTQDVFATVPDEARQTPEGSDVVLHLNAVDKRYPGVHALKGVSLEVRRGEIHALVGENGAGKSTLVGVAAGSVTADSGSVVIGGETTDSPTPDWCRESGLAIVYQEPALLPDLTVAENMALAMPAEHRPAVGEQVRWARQVLSDWSTVARIDPRIPVRELRPDARFVVEISRALAEDPKVLILDEPTEHLLPPAVEELFKLVNQHVERGGAVVYISHRLGEVKRIADRVSVLRDGALVGTFDASTMSEQDVINLVVGRELEAPEPRSERIAAGEVRGELLTVKGFSGHEFHDVGFSVRAGEIVGFAGIEGQGQREVLRALAGLTDGSGTIEVGGRPVSTRSVAAARRGGISYLPQDRHNEGVFPGLSLRENAAASALGSFSTLGFVSGGKERKEVRGRFAGLRVKAPSSEVDITTLSGGNQQKVMLSRVLIGGSQVLLADEPTQGVDVGAREEIYEFLREAAAEGMSIIVLSSSAKELEQLCDRVLVFSRGQVVAELTDESLHEHAITQAALTASKSRAAAVIKTDKASGPVRRIVRSDLTPSVVLGVAIIALGFVAAAKSPFYLTDRNFSLFLPLVAILAFFALAQQLVMMVGGIDLSVGPLAGFLVVVGSFTLAAYRSTAGMIIGVAVVVLCAIAVGVVNWLLTSVAKINALIATLVTFTALQGLGLLLRPLPAGQIDPFFTANVRALLLTVIPLMLAIAVVVAIVLEVGLYRSRRGIMLRAVGSNVDTARRVGLSPRWTTLAAYVGCSVLVVPASLLLMAQAGTGNATIGDSYTLASISAVVLGGASIFGGRGSFVGAVMGAALIVQINTVVQFLGLDLYWQQWLLGGLTLAAVAFYSKARTIVERSAK
ncbi:ABC transporter ATP-binding protein [Nocardioides aromaticivorans]|uniref:ABC transporter ATP-binding protein n=1 Tax=Nocardioides aromaticivorans TaxID=200618 RepID=A0ABX7PS14_9ACTN|nr:ATP-binding cassette domain-containing protein [Nocardioides aromaticivorans]QSR28804.1 ABC transporter ATP-binding protein [Nocardioides aromaticivorans]